MLWLAGVLAASAAVLTSEGATSVPHGPTTPEFTWSSSAFAEGTDFGCRYVLRGTDPVGCDTFALSHDAARSKLRLTPSSALRPGTYEVGLSAGTEDVVVTVTVRPPELVVPSSGVTLFAEVDCPCGGAWFWSCSPSLSAPLSLRTTGDGGALGAIRVTDVTPAGPKLSPIRGTDWVQPGERLFVELRGSDLAVGDNVGVLELEVGGLVAQAVPYTVTVRLWGIWLPLTLCFGAGVGFWLGRLRDRVEGKGQRELDVAQRRARLEALYDEAEGTEVVAELDEVGKQLDELDVANGDEAFTDTLADVDAKLDEQRDRLRTARVAWRGHRLQWQRAVDAFGALSLSPPGAIGAVPDAAANPIRSFETGKRRAKEAAAWLADTVAPGRAQVLAALEAAAKAADPSSIEQFRIPLDGLVSELRRPVKVRGDTWAAVIDAAEAVGAERRRVDELTDDLVQVANRTFRRRNLEGLTLPAEGTAVARLEALAQAWTRGRREAGDDTNDDLGRPRDEQRLGRRGGFAHRGRLDAAP
jgi:hypothetical protein